jgi:hypothetical protein
MTNANEISFLFYLFDELNEVSIFQLANFFFLCFKKANDEYLINYINGPHIAVYTHLFDINIG